MHALAIEVDLDSGFAPRAGGEELVDTSYFSGSFGLGYTYFVRGTGFYVGAGAGISFASLTYEPHADLGAYYDYGYVDVARSVGFDTHARVGYDWHVLGVVYLGASLTIRSVALTDTTDGASWRGAAMSVSGSVAYR